jgi:hypothetical protein
MRRQSAAGMTLRGDPHGKRVRGGVAVPFSGRDLVDCPETASGGVERPWPPRGGARRWRGPWRGPPSFPSAAGDLGRKVQFHCTAVRLRKKRHHKGYGPRRARVNECRNGIRDLSGASVQGPRPTPGGLGSAREHPFRPGPVITRYAMGRATRDCDPHGERRPPRPCRGRADALSVNYLPAASAWRCTRCSPVRERWLWAHMVQVCRRPCARLPGIRSRRWPPH